MQLFFKHRELNKRVKFMNALRLRLHEHFDDNLFKCQTAIQQANNVAMIRILQQMILHPNFN